MERNGTHHWPGIHNLGSRKGALKSVNVWLTRSEVYNNVDEKNGVRKAVEGYPAGWKIVVEEGYGNW